MTKLTKRQKGFVKDYVKTGNGTLSAKNNYNVTTDGSARSYASQILTNVNIQKALAERLPDDLLEEKHLALLNKMTLIGNEIDVNAVAKGLDMAYKVKGTYAPDKTLNINMNVQPIDPTNPEVLELIDKLRKANESK